MTLSGLKQPPFSTSMLGVVRGAADYFAIEVSTPILYGGSGHAFLANIHEELCPSGPYCWNHEHFLRLLGNLGIEMKDHGFIHSGTSANERKKMEETLKAFLDGGTPCSLLNMDNQLILGYDKTGFIVAQPWGPMDDVTPGHLSFGSWAEFGNEIHMNFFSLHKKTPVDRVTLVKESLGYALDLFTNPESHTEPAYGVGPKAFTNWKGAVENGHGKEHGAWWNAMVWGECRKMAQAYLTEIGVEFPQEESRISSLAASYGEIGDLLLKAADKEMEPEEKVKVLKEAEALELRAVEEIRTFVTATSTPR